LNGRSSANVVVVVVEVVVDVVVVDGGVVVVVVLVVDVVGGSVVVVVGRTVDVVATTVVLGEVDVGFAEVCPNELVAEASTTMAMPVATIIHMRLAIGSILVGMKPRTTAPGPRAGSGNVAPHGRTTDDHDSRQ
jgi:hypothetical protein